MTRSAMRPAWRRPAFAAAPLALLLGCAPAATTPLGTTSREETIIIDSETGSMEARLRRDEYVARAEVPLSRSEAWRLLPHVFEQLGLPEPVADQRTWTVAIADHSVQRRLGSTPLATYLDCGAGITGEHANTHRIRLSVRTMLERVDESSTRVHTRVNATARSTGGTSSAPLPCGSRGTLEQEITRLLQGRTR